MRRIHLLELEDLSWFPQTWRNGLTDYLSFLYSIYYPFQAIVPKLRTVLDQIGSCNIVDLCSGAATPIVKLVRELNEQSNHPITVTLTDKFPNLDAFKITARSDRAHIQFCEQPLDACAVPQTLPGFRTLFTAFHHFRPAQAELIMRDAITNADGIGIFEVTDRSSMAFVRVVVFTLLVFVFTPFIKPFSFKRLFWTYIFPIIPAGVLWDGIVSNLRTYSKAELEDLVQKVGVSDDDLLEIGKINAALGIQISYLIWSKKRSSSKERIPDVARMSRGASDNFIPI